MKITDIEEAQNFSNITVYKLISPLQTFEMFFNDISEKMNKGITFVYNTEGVHGDKEESLLDSITLLGKKSSNP